VRQSGFFFSLMNKVFSYLKEVRSELTKVVWPKRDEVIKLTLVVLIISAIVGGYVGALDYIFTNLLKTILTQ